MTKQCDERVFESLFHDFAIGFIKYDFEKSNGRPPKYGEIDNVYFGGVKIQLRKEDFDGEQAAEDE